MAKPETPNQEFFPKLPKTQFIPLAGEEWREFIDDPELQTLRRRRYAVSSFGRIASYYENLYVDGRLMKLTKEQTGFRKIDMAYHTKVEKNGKLVNERHNCKQWVHIMVAKAFIENPDPENKTRAVHLDYDRDNNHYTNLKWVDNIEAYHHFLSNPDGIEKQNRMNSRGHKLNPAKVKMIKKMLLDKKTRIRIIAKQFGVSTTVIDHIKSGKYWADVKLDEND